MLLYLFFLGLEGQGLGIIVIFLFFTLFCFFLGGFPGHFNFSTFPKKLQFNFKILSKQIFSNFKSFFDFFCCKYVLFI